MNNKKNRTIIIIGAGIAGLTAALSFTRIGYRVSIIERSSKIDDVGVGIQLSPNATHILAELGLARQAIAAAFAPENVIINNGNSGKELSRLPLGESITKRHGFPYLVLHRGDLASLLLTACKNDPDISIDFETSFEDMSEHKNGITVLATRAGKVLEYTGCALIGADGVNSKVRSDVIHGNKSIPSGDIAWRTLVPVEKLPEGTDINNTKLWLGANGHVVCYPVRDKSKLNIVAVTPQSCASEITRRTMNAEPQALKGFYATWCRDVRNLLDAAEDWSGWPLNPVNPRGKWSHKCTVLIGDAAHATMPYAAQGGVAAIEDAAVLAKAFAQGGKDPAEAIARFVKARKPRATKVWDLATKNRRIYHMSGPAALVRNAVLRAYSPDRFARRMDWLFGWKV